MAEPAPPIELCLSAIDHWSTYMTKAEWSGWVQAIGSVAAIVAAASIVLLQHWLEMRRARKAQRADRADAVEAYAQYAAATHQKMLDFLAHCVDMSHDVSWFHCLSAELLAIETGFLAQDMRLLKGYAELSLVTDALGLIKITAKHVGGVVSQHSTHPTWPNYARVAMEGLPEQMADRKTRLLALADQLRAEV